MLLSGGINGNALDLPFLIDQPEMHNRERNFGTGWYVDTILEWSEQRRDMAHSGRRRELMIVVTLVSDLWIICNCFRRW